MNKIVLIACCSNKRAYPTPAWRLYVSPLFRKSLAYAMTLGAERTYVLSARHGLVGLHETLEPYDLTLADMTRRGRRAWARGVATQIEAQTQAIRPRHFVILAGRAYYEYLLPHLPSAEVPMPGLGIGERLAWLNEKLEEAHVTTA